MIFSSIFNNPNPQNSIHNYNFSSPNPKPSLLDTVPSQAAMFLCNLLSYSVKVWPPFDEENFSSKNSEESSEAVSEGALARLRCILVLYDIDICIVLLVIKRSTH